LEGLEGRRYGPIPFRLCRDKVDEFIAATSDQADRWVDHAPPAMAAAALFAVAPLLLSDPEVEKDARSVIHAEQRFTWLGSLPIEGDLMVTGIVARARKRGSVVYASFDLNVVSEGGPLIEGSSTFLMSGEQGPAGDWPEEEEPAPDHRAGCDVLTAADDFTPLARSASRSDLVRYAGATRDWNPIHWDHSAATMAGLPGVVVHGLLQASWLAQSASRLRSDPYPLHSARFRFREPLRPAVATVIKGSFDGGRMIEAELISGERVFVAASIELT
jgi:hypothetical protein